MKNFTLRLRTISLLLAAVLAVSAVCWVGCGGGDSGTNSGGGGSGVVNNCGRDGTAGACGEAAIGGLTWMSQNLNLETEGSWCYGEGGLVENGNLVTQTLTPSEIQANCNKYGRLYTREAAALACQSVGWRLPTVEEWDALGEAVGGEKDFKPEPYTGIVFHNWYNASIPLMAKNGWTCSECAGTDDYGFAALPGGSGLVSLTTKIYGDIGFMGNWWASDDWDGVSGVEGSFMISGGIKLWGMGYRYYGNQHHVYSVRCVKD